MMVMVDFQWSYETTFCFNTSMTEIMLLVTYICIFIGGFKNRLHCFSTVVCLSETRISSCMPLFAGNLYFAHVMSPDEGEYVCQRENPVYRGSVKGDDKRIFPEPLGNDSLQKPWHGLLFLIGWLYPRDKAPDWPTPMHTTYTLVPLVN